MLHELYEYDWRVQHQLFVPFRLLCLLFAHVRVHARARAHRRKPGLTAAEYFVVVAYLLFYYKLIYAIFPDNRLSAAEVVQMEKDLNTAIPSSCTFLALDRVAFVPKTAGQYSDVNSLMGQLYGGCGLNA